MVDSLYTITGKVQEGKKRGKRLGYPTVNFPIDSSIPQGIYISQTFINKKSYNSLTFIGEAKTFNETKLQAETYILDFEKDIYGVIIKVQLLKKLRENQKFSSEKELIIQMDEDKKQAQKFFRNLT